MQMFSHINPMAHVAPHCPNHIWVNGIAMGIIGVNYNDCTYGSGMSKYKDLKV